MLSMATALRNAMLDRITAAIDAGSGPGTLRVYGNTRPSTCATPGTPLLAELTFSKPSANPSASGQWSSLPILPDMLANAAGTATWARAVDSNGNCVMDVSVGISGAEIIMSNPSIAAGSVVSCGGITITDPSTYTPGGLGIASVTGTFADGQSITISGSNFGFGPNVLLFHSMANGSTGTVIPLTAPQVGQWTMYGQTTGRPRYSAVAGRSGGKGWDISDDYYCGSPPCDLNVDNSNRIGQLQMQLPGKITEIFFSYATLIPSGTTFPGSSTPSTFNPGSNWKMFWLFDNFGWNSGDNLADLCVPTWVIGGSYLAGNTTTNVLTPSEFTAGGINNTNLISFTGWSRMAFWLKGGTPIPTDPNGRVYVQGITPEYGLRHHTWTDRSPFQTNAPGQWDGFTMPGWFGNNDHSSNQVCHDDIYVATGPNAAARVEIGDASVYANCTNLAICTPTSWSDSTIVATVRRGGFTAFSGKYVFVVDATNTPTTGYLIP